MEMPAHEWEAIDIKLDLAHHHSIRLRRWRNINTCPLFRLPIELLIDILGQTLPAYGGFRFWVVLTAICHPLREMLVCSSFPWRIVDTDSVPLAKLFLERSKFDPYVLFAMDRGRYSRKKIINRTAFWEATEGRKFNNLSFLVFRGQRAEFEESVVDFLQRAPRLSSLEVEASSFTAWDLEWTHGDQLPNLTMLRLNKVRISWECPLIRNLTKLILSYACVTVTVSSEPRPFRAFLSALENCPDLEVLHLTDAGPDSLPSDEDDHEVVQLHKLQNLTLCFDDKSVVACILSHIWFPEATKVAVETSCYNGLAGALSQVLPSSDAGILQYLRKTTTVAIGFDCMSSQLATDNFSLVLVPDFGDGSDRSDLETFPQFVSKALEIIGGDTVVNLEVAFKQPYYLPRETWKTMLNCFPRLEVISYSVCSQLSGQGSVDVDPFCSILSKSPVGGLVCPQLRCLRIPWSLTQDLSASTLRETLFERAAGGKRLKRISLSSHAVDEMGLLETFKGVVDKVSKFCAFGSPLPSSTVSRFVE